jgi:TolB-like protein
MSDIFVSYASEDLERVKPLVAALEDCGWSVWWDREIGAGTSYDQVIEAAIDDAKCVLVIWSAHSIESEWVRNEASEGLERNILVPILVDDVRPPLAFRRRQTADLIDWSSSSPGFAKMTEAIGEILGSTGEISPIADLKPNSRMGLLISIGVVCLGAIALLYVIWQDASPTIEDVTTIPPGTVESATANKAATSPNGIRSNWVAVLPFTPASESNESRVFAEGITSDLISSLSIYGLGLFSVTSHGAVKAYGDSSLSPHQIANELGIRYLIEGRIQTSGEQIRIGVAIIDGIEEKTLWDESKTYQDADLFDIQDDFSDFAGQVINGQLHNFESVRVRNIPPANMSAWEHYTRATMLLSTTGNPTQERFTLTISELRLVVELEPDNAPALASLANHINLNTYFGGSPDPAASRQEACRLANSAITLNNIHPPFMFSSFITLAQFCGEAEKAVQLGMRTLELFKNSLMGKTFQGGVLFWAGKLDEALKVLEAAEQNSLEGPLRPTYYAPLYKSFIYAERQEWEAALELSRTALNLDPANVFHMIQLANVLGVLNRPAEAKEYWRQVLERFPNFTIENYEWWWKQGVITDERVEPHVRGLKRVRVGKQK